jgi:hypothetical protein
VVTGAGSAGTTDRWSTRPAVRSVLAIVHNVTAATRLFDVLQLLGGDERLRVVFTCTGSSAFHDGTLEYLSARGVRYLPWEEALAEPVELAISASYGGDLHLINSPLLVIPHGMGYNKYLETRNSKLETRNSKLETRNSKLGFRFVA